jgi:hypothetical protein
MKKIIASAGLVTVSAVALQAVEAPGLSPLQTAKWWSVSAALRGFYDGNPLTQNSSVDYDGSFGISIIPSFAANFPRDQTYIGASVQYMANWYENRPDNSWDQNLQAALKLTHKFSPRYNLSFDDVFTYADEPTVVDSGGIVTNPTQLRSDSSGMRNRPSLNFTALLTERVGVQVGFANLWYDYFQDQDQAIEDSIPPGGGPPSNPLGLNSLAATLNRLEYYPSIDLRYQVREDLVGLVGYQFGVVDYTSNDPLTVDISDPLNPEFVSPSVRNSQSQYMYVGGEYTLSQQLTAAGKVGATYTTFEDLSSNDGWTPYIDGSVTYQYLPGSQVVGGVRYQPSVTDLAAAGPSVTDLDQITANSDSWVVYAQVNHRITPRITGNVLTSIQHNLYQGGTFNDDVDWFFLAGLSLDYRINQHLSAEVGYNYDRLDSDISGRSYTRNRGYVGVRGTY